MNEYMRMADRIYDLENYMKQLEKENAELKTLIKSEHEIEVRKNSSLILQLTKAKNVLNLFINACEDYEISEARAEAEQFISEVEK